MNTAERKIRDALDKAAAYCLTGEDPNQAVSKAALELQLNPEMTKRAVEAFNIAITNAGIRRASDKTASFPIADIDIVLENVFAGSSIAGASSESKTAAPDLAQEFVEIPGENVFDMACGRKYAAPLGDLHEVVKQGRSLLLEQKIALDSQKLDLIALSRDMHNSIQGIVDYFSFSANQGKFANFEAAILSEYGEQAKPTLDILHDLLSLPEDRCDFMPKAGSLLVEPDYVTIEFDKLARITGEYLQAADRFAVCFSDHVQKTAEMEQSIRSACGLEPQPSVWDPGEFVNTSKSGEFSRAHASENHSVFEDGAAPLMKEAGNDRSAADLLCSPGDKFAAVSLGFEAPAGTIFQAAQSGLGKGLGEHYAKAHQKALELAIKGPKEQVDMEMDNVKRQAILRDLMTNDEIISKQDPKDVQRLYNTLLGIAPNLTLHPSVVQSVLRTGTAQQALDPFAAKQLSDLQEQDVKNKQILSGKITPAGTRAA